jgi:hypothetical protein
MALRFRFLDEQDIAQFGDRWWVWDKDEFSGVRGRELVALEELVDMPMWQIRRDMATGSTLATMAAMFIAMHRAGTPTGAWDDFNPMVNHTAWEVAPEAPLASGGDPAPDSGSSTTSEPSTGFASS